MKGYDIKIRLDDYRPLTWRDLIIPADITFEQLNYIIQILNNFNGFHLYAFRINNGDITISQKEYLEDLAMWGYEGLLANETLINEFFETYDKISYTYDFGDSWEFTIEVKKTVDYDKNYPTIKRYKGDYCPIDDVGGTWELMELTAYKMGEIDSLPDYLMEWLEYLEEFDQDEMQDLLKEYCSYERANNDSDK